MSAKYKLVRNPNPKKDGELLPYHARIVANRTTSTEELIEDAKEISSFSSADIKGMIQLLHDVIAKNLLFGNNVEVEGIGTFTVALKCTPVVDKKKIRAENVWFHDVNFRSSKKLRQRLTAMRVYRAKEIKKKEFTPEECQKRLLCYIDQHGYITSSVYMSLNHCGKTKAKTDLKRFTSEKVISRKGRGPTTFYIKAVSKN